MTFQIIFILLLFVTIVFTVMLEDEMDNAPIITAISGFLIALMMMSIISKISKPDYQIELDHNNIIITDKQGNDTVISADSSIDKFIEYDQR